MTYLRRLAVSSGGACREFLIVFDCIVSGLRTFLCCLGFCFPQVPNPRRGKKLCHTLLHCLQKALWWHNNSSALTAAGHWKMSGQDKHTYRPLVRLPISAPLKLPWSLQRSGVTRQIVTLIHCLRALQKTSAVS